VEWLIPTSRRACNKVVSSEVVTERRLDWLLLWLSAFEILLVMLVADDFTDFVVRDVPSTSVVWALDWDLLSKDPGSDSVGQAKLVELVSAA
jgi:hypothetical protein